MQAGKCVVLSHVFLTLKELSATFVFLCTFFLFIVVVADSAAAAVVVVVVVVVIFREFVVCS